MAALHSEVWSPRGGGGILFRLTVVIATLLVVGSGQAEEDGWQEAALQRAISYYQASRPDVCEADATPTESYKLRLGEETAARAALMVAFACRSLDTGQSSVFVLSDQYGTVSDQVFPTPVIASGEAADIDATAIEWQQRREVLNAAYEPDGRTMIAVETWSNTDEIRIRTQWGFYLGLFRLMRFEVDAAADGRQELVVLIENETW